MKVLCIGDMHFGERGNSRKFNEQLLTFIDWCVDRFEGEVDAVVQFGDYFHNRTKVQLDTLNYAIEGAKKLSNAFGKNNVKVLSGNHDLFFLDRLDTSSLAAIEPYVDVIYDIAPLGEDTMMVPWVTDGEMWDKIINQSYHYKNCFGHFELNGFRLNAGYVMEHGYSPKALKKFENVLTGHYHSHQVQGNIRYLGTPIPITMNEANEDHGVFVFDTVTGVSEFIKYDTVKVLSVPYDQLDETLKDIDPENTSIRVEFPDDLEDETLIAETQERLSSLNFEETKIKYLGKKAKELLESEVDDIGEVENIDEVVINFIRNTAQINGIDKDYLERWYSASIERSKEIAGE